jgi:hypothetical protein
MVFLFHSPQRRSDMWQYTLTKIPQIPLAEELYPKIKWRDLGFHKLDSSQEEELLG